MTSQPKTYLTREEYLAIERKSEFRSEYFDGDMVAMTGASRRHNLIAINIAGELRQQLKGKPCELYANDMRVKVTATGLYTYPDVVVVCGEPRFEDDYVDTLLNPTLIVEVLSPSTELYDRSKKSGHYRTIETLTEYLLVAQDEYKIEQYVRGDDGRWILSDTKGVDSLVRLESVGSTLPLSEVYDRVVISDAR
jgi:Uma2 family endonuclease